MSFNFSVERVLGISNLEYKPKQLKYGTVLYWTMRQEQAAEAEKRVSDALTLEEKAKKPTFKCNKAYLIIKEKFMKQKMVWRIGEGIFRMNCLLQRSKKPLKLLKI